MTTQRTLSFLATTAGIEIARAEQLWQLASDHAAGVTGESGSVRHLSLAREQMITLVEQEVLIGQSLEDAPWLMIQAHVSVLPLIVADIFVQAVRVTSQLVSRCKSKSQAALNDLSQV